MSDKDIRIAMKSAVRLDEVAVHSELNFMSTARNCHQMSHGHQIRFRLLATHVRSNLMINIDVADHLVFASFLCEGTMSKLSMSFTA